MTAEKLKNIIMILPALLTVAVYIILVSPNKDTQYEISQVSVKVIKIDSYYVSDKPQKGIRYNVEAEYDGRRYKLGPLANCAYSEGMTYSMYMCDDKLYVDTSSAQSAIEDKGRSIYFRIAVGIALFGTIILIWASASYYYRIRSKE